MLSICLLKSLNPVSECLWTILRVHIARIWARGKTGGDKKLSGWKWPRFARKRANRSSFRSNAKPAIYSLTPILHTVGAKLTENNPAKNMWIALDAKQSQARTELYWGWQDSELFAKLWSVPDWWKGATGTGDGCDDVEVCVLTVSILFNNWLCISSINDFLLIAFSILIFGKRSEFFILIKLKLMK
jgi:hypothetical protein